MLCMVVFVSDVKSSPMTRMNHETPIIDDFETMLVVL